MQKIWLASYPAGVPEFVNLDEYSSIGQLFEKSCEQYADRIAYINMGKGLTYRELNERSAEFAAYLQQELKLPQGTRIALMMPNCLQYPVAMFGALRAGYVVVNCNPLYTARELEHQLKDSGAEVIVVLENFCHTVQTVIAATPLRHVVVASLGDMLGIKGMVVNFVVRHIKKMVPAWSIAGAVRFNDALEAGSNQALQPVNVELKHIAFLQYTGGTTGVAKGAMLTHRNIIANLQQACAWINAAVHGRPQLIVTALPLYHIFALTANCLAFMRLGATNLLITNPRDIPGFVKEIGKYPFTAITGVNTLYNALMNHPNFDKLDFSSLDIALGGGMAVQHAVADRWKRITGKALVEAYGLTETSPAVTMNPLDMAEYNGSIGLPIPSTEVSIRDDDGREVAVGEPGELCVRGPQVMAGYYNRPEETAKVMTADGYLKTGDVAVINAEGFLRIVDRKKDMILVSGFNVYPNEVEDVLAACPGVLECAVVGVQDERSGEAVKAFVVKKDANLTAEQVVRYCRENLTGYKVPHQVEFRDSLPKTNVGKILRRALRDEAKVNHAAD